MRNIKPRYNYYLNNEPYGNDPHALMDVIGIEYDRSHRQFRSWIKPFTGLVTLSWADWDADTPKGRIVRILRNEEEVLKSRTPEMAQRIKNNRDADKNKRRNS